jgi:putative transposase
VFVTPATAHPNEAWVCNQAKAFTRHAEESGLGAGIVMHGRDTKFTSQFDATLKHAGVRVQKAAYRSPNTVAFVERFNQTLRQELLDHFIVFGERHLNHLVAVFIDYYNVPSHYPFVLCA